MAASLYWGEGNKSEFNIINSDPFLLVVIVECLKDIGVDITDIKAGLRLFKGVKKKQAVTFWSEAISLPVKNFVFFEKIQKGHGLGGKFLNGMCRIRVKKGARIFKLMMSVIDFIKSDSNAAVVQWIEQGTPKS